LCGINARKKKLTTAFFPTLSCAVVFCIALFEKFKRQPKKLTLVFFEKPIKIFLIFFCLEGKQHGQ
jgi:hypothetical protein